MKNEKDLLDLAAKKIGARNDAQLARGLGMQPATISNIRAGRVVIGATVAVRIHEVTDIPVAFIKSYLTRGPLALGASK